MDEVIENVEENRKASFRDLIKSLGGFSAVADACGVRSPTVHYWSKKGLPRTEWTGETHYAESMANLAASEGKHYTLEAIRDCGHPANF